MKPHQAPESSGTLMMLLSVVLFATNALLLRAMSLHLPVANGWVALLYRGVVGIAIVVALYGFNRGLSIRAFFGNPLVVLRGVIGALSTAAFYLSISHLGAARAVVLSLTYPIFATLIAAWWLKERTPRAALLWMFAAFGGLLVFLGGDANRAISAWDLLALSGAVGAGIVVVMIRKLRETEHAGTIYGSLCVFCILLALPMGSGVTLALPALGQGALIAAACVVGVSQLLMTNAYRSLPVSRGSSIQMLLPIVTAVGAWFLFDERFSVVEFAGAALTLFATWRVALVR